MNKYIKWGLYFLPVLAVEILSFLTNPIACLFVTKRPRFDRIKRQNSKSKTMDREYLWGWFDLWSTHDNAVDEYWYGWYTRKSIFKFVREATQKDYDSSWWFRYFMRLLWVSRNIGYGWNYLLFSVPKGEGWQYEGTYTINVNIGWKSHKEQEKLLYANRIFRFGKVK